MPRGSPRPDQRRRRARLRIDAQHAAVAGVADEHRAAVRDCDAVRTADARRERAAAEREGLRSRRVEHGAARRDCDRADLGARVEDRHGRGSALDALQRVAVREVDRAARASSRPRTASRAPTRRRQPSCRGLHAVDASGAVLDDEQRSVRLEVDRRRPRERQRLRRRRAHRDRPEARRRAGRLRAERPASGRGEDEACAVSAVAARRADAELPRPRGRDAHDAGERAWTGRQRRCPRSAGDDGGGLRGQRDANGSRRARRAGGREERRTRDGEPRHGYCDAAPRRRLQVFPRAAREPPRTD